ncbi:PHB depolymerase family esterase [Plantactinospora sp. KBS50]|uniref:extracellular catalytic domain type 1 short-chain-length polyhydroxyalkanoate depolymerase n=1 Tax=Plantactinospora sp. KBS50 TaxID=2024580 RepID=UPI000BAB0F46|nr:PHB depolymerase family esterase [Plantactinospora sp. KBS50]ASW57639.1 esterase [Plantactinospora sp. KBS50]
MRSIRTVLAGLSVALAVGGVSVLAPVLTGPAAAASLVEVTNFGNNPGGMRMHVYVPDGRPANPAIVVAMHGCGGSGPGFYSGSEFAALADRYGYLVIYPTATQQAGFGNCFDTWSDAAKRRGGGSDPVSIASMVSYAEQQYGGDPNRIYATGSSSGGMMTNEMLALYPDVFRAGAAFMGVPFNCFASAADYPPGSSQCTGGSMNRTPQQWGDAVRQAYPGYTGPRPRVQLWHGTADTLVPYSLLAEEIEQWTNVFGLSQTPTATDTPQSGWSRRRYADGAGTVQVEAYSIAGAGHSLPMTGMAAQAVTFFGLTTTPTTPPPSTPPPTTPPPSTPPPTTPPPSTPPPTTPPPSTPPPAGACSASYRTTSSWPGGFQGEVTVTAGGSAISGWTVQWSLGAGQSITQLWNGTLSTSGSSVSVRNVAYNGSIPAGGSTTFGFLGSGTPTSPTPSCTSP